jgi:hypothetical protein
MENRVIRSVNGQALRNPDITMISDAGALADDHVLWELLRMLPGSATPQKGILPYAVSGYAPPASGDGFTLTLHNSAIVQGNASDGSIRVLPFRAIVGSTTLFATSPIEKLRGVRSGYLVGGTDLYTTVAITANAAGSPRWTGVYVAITPDANAGSTSVKVKDPATGAVSPQTINIYKTTTVTVATVDGTAAANPTRPSIPADGAGTYYLPLAWILVPAGFGASSQVLFSSIHEDATVLTMSSALGVSTLAPANQQHKVGGTVETRQNPNLNASKRTGAYLPSTLVGGFQRVIALQLGLSPVSHNDGDVVDDSVDYRQRFFKWTVFAGAGTTTAAAFVSDGNGTGAAGATTRVPSAFAGGGVGVNTMIGAGQSFFNDYPAGAIGTCSGVACSVGSITTADATVQAVSALGASGSTVILYVRSTDGALVYKKTGTPSGQVFIWLEATGQFSNSNSF